MKKLFYLLSLLFVVSFTSCSEAYDDSDIVGRLDDLEKEVEDLREEVEASKTLLNALANNLTIKSVAETTEGYVITFSDDSSITVKHGKKGEDGKDGEDGADGEDGKDGQDGADGKDGDNLIASITINEDSVTFVLTNGQIVTIALNGDATTPDDGEEELPTDGNPLANVTCASNEILYTTKYGLPIELGNTQGFGGNLVYNTYEKGIGRLTFGNDVTAIPDNAFKDCNSMEYIKLPEGVTSIGSQAFYDCTSLTGITIPNSVTSIGDSAFSGCSGELVINSKSLIERDYTYGNAPSAWLYGSKFSSLVIGDNVTKIGERAFYDCSSLASIIIPDSVTSIGDSAFNGCSSLTGITIPDSVTSIGDYAFYCCSSLESITISDSVTSIGDYAFYYCSSLESITIPDSVTSIGDRAFNRCSRLTSITIPNTVTSIGDYAFNYCSSLESITIPDSVTSIGGSAFSGCSGELVINNYFFAGRNYSYSIYPNKDSSLWLYGSKFSSLVIGDNVTKIGDYAFYYCSSLESITISDSVTSIGDYAFYYCSSLESIAIPDSVTSIGEWAFSGCSSLASITIPDSVTSIGDYAFYGCSSLKEVYCKPTTPPTTTYGVFDENTSDCKIYVPTESVEAYKSADGWNEYADAIEPYEFE